RRDAEVDVSHERADVARHPLEVEVCSRHRGRHRVNLLRRSLSTEPSPVFAAWNFFLGGPGSKGGAAAPCALLRLIRRGTDQRPTRWTRPRRCGASTPAPRSRHPELHRTSGGRTERRAPVRTGGTPRLRAAPARSSRTPECFPPCCRRPAPRRPYGRRTRSPTHTFPDRDSRPPSPRTRIRGEGEGSQHSTPRSDRHHEQAHGNRSRRVASPHARTT